MNDNNQWRLEKKYLKPRNGEKKEVALSMDMTGYKPISDMTIYLGGYKILYYENERLKQMCIEEWVKS